MRQANRNMRWSIIVCVLLSACNGPVAEHPPSSQTTSGPANMAQVAKAPTHHVGEKLASQYLPNLARISDNVYSGGLLEDEAALKELADLGVKTIINVDGMKPDVATARKFNLRYVHLPHGYDGISPQRAKELAKAVWELDGPINIHCHHGKQLIFD